MRSKRKYEGYLMIDHRNSPGISDEAAIAAGLPPGAGRGLFEAPTITCSHCQAIVVINPDRRRERAYCAKCNRYICDACGALYGMTRECRSFVRQLDEVHERVERQGSLLLLGE